MSPELLKDDLNKQAWDNPANWRGPPLLAAYYSSQDSRLWVPKRIPMMGWTINLGHPRAMHWQGLAGIVLCLLPALVVAILRWSSFVSVSGAWPWLATSLALTLVAALANGLVRRRWSWMPVALAFGVFAAISGFGIQSILNVPVVALFGGAANLTWTAHLYLALTAALAQTFGKCAFLALVWFALRAESLADKVRAGLLVGLGFTVFEIILIWAQAIWVGQPIAGWWIGGLERGISSFFHIYSTGLLAMALARRRQRFPLIALVVLVHYFNDWAAGANASLLHLSDIHIEALFAIPVGMLFVIFLILTRGLRREPVATT